MSLPENIGDREYQKFVETAEGEVAVRQGPNAITDDAGNILSLDEFGRASSIDISVVQHLKEISSLLHDIRYQLQLITGAHINE
jgi:hypothetical protein